MELKAQIVKSGTWAYDGTSLHEVWIVRQNFDFYDDEGYQDTSCVSPDETVFQVLYAYDGEKQSVSRVCRSLEEAITLAEETCSKITWDNHRLQPLFHGRRYKLEE
jgi:hypothetical protein